MTERAVPEKKRRRRRRGWGGCHECKEAFYERTGSVLSPCERCHKYYCTEHLWDHKNPDDRRRKCRKPSDRQMTLL